MFIGHFKGPFLIWSEFAVDIFEISPATSVASCQAASSSRSSSPTSIGRMQLCGFSWPQRFFSIRLWPQCAHAFEQPRTKDP